jgi:hypothetical protein
MGHGQGRSASEGSWDEAVIRTPDRRLRVFVSSTLGELAEERGAVVRAISALRLIPVLFELGARPYPPREVYQQYLAQSDVFIGLYWQRYGQPAPGAQVSGLEEEFELSGDLPRLLYIKSPAPDREPRLAELLARLQDEASASYRHFRTPAELGRLVRDDLAVLLSERFAAAGHPAAAGAPPSPGRSRGPRPLPAGTTSLIGREQDIGEVVGLLGRPGVRLVTLTGPGEIGKTRLAIAAGDRLRDRFAAGVVFVPLAAVTEPGLVLAGIARAAQADLAGTGLPLEALAERFGDADWLLILDNLEQVVGAGRDLAGLLAHCPGLAVLATSRTVLGLAAEREYPVPSLALPASAPPGSAGMPLAEVAASPAVALFVDRARAVRPGFALTEENAAAVAEICRRLEGLPLAIELAAARTRLLDPGTLLRRLAASLDALGTGAVDLPERQQTLRATVECEMRDIAERFGYAWLAARSRALLGTLAVMQGRLDQARELLDKALELSLAIRVSRNVALCLVGFARLALAEGDAERAALAVGAANGLRRRAGLRAWPVLRGGEADLTAQIRQVLGTARFDQVFASGSGLSQREAAAAVRGRPADIQSGRSPAGPHRPDQQTRTSLPVNLTLHNVHYRRLLFTAVVGYGFLVSSRRTCQISARSSTRVLPHRRWFGLTQSGPER